jgi:heme/copper-type cytochrome/quinol oxidase subunit 2
MESKLKKGDKIRDRILFGLLLVIIVGLPLGIWAVEQNAWPKDTPATAKRFTLSGNAYKGWILGDVHGFDVVSFWKDRRPNSKPVLRVVKGDWVVLKLKSSDVVHGFSLKDFGVYIEDGIQPGKTLYVSFMADKTGTFTFSCNAICGELHENMQGTLIVAA